MPARNEIAYFGAGPAPLPTPILEAGAASFLNHQNSGLGLVEISHRSSTANSVLADAKAALTKLMSIPDNYEILFCHGGGTGGFASVVHNLVPVWVEKRRKIAEQELGEGREEEVIARVKQDIKDHLRCDYLVTGSWSLKASQEAANLLEPLALEGKKKVNVALDAREKNGGKFGAIPHEDMWKLSGTPEHNSVPGAAFVYFCDNETVDGVEFQELALRLQRDERIPVADMSSNFLSREIDVSKYGVIFGGAQKNIGITDITIQIIRKDLLNGQASPAFLHKVGIWSPPSILHWPTLAKNNSLYNTLPIFSVHVAAMVMNSLLEKHGPLDTGSQAKESEEKARTIYEFLDAHPDIFTINPEKSVRSRMNICFRIKDDATEKKFLEGAEQRGLLGLKGHRSVGGIRLSNYNAVSLEQVKKVRAWLEEFVKTL